MKPNLKWHQVQWTQVQLRVQKLQEKIYKASLEKNQGKVRAYQDILIKSSSAKLMAVRRVTQDNRGKKTAAMDAKKNVQPELRVHMARGLKLDGKASPIRRVYNPKPGSDVMKPLGIPTMNDRGKQALAKMALEPEWEAKFEPNSYGFRPGRSCHDAIEAIWSSINQTPKGKYVFDATMAKCFDTMCHAKLLMKLDTSPKLKRQIAAWLKAGIFEHQRISDSTQGTPQEGVISPLLSNIALHGMENHLNQWILTQRVTNPKGHVLQDRGKLTGLSLVRYADDFVILHKDREIVTRAGDKVASWLSDNAGLVLSQAKTRLAHTDSPMQGQTGFDFLGVHVRRYVTGQYGGNKLATETKTLIKPSIESVKKHRRSIKTVLRYTNQIEVVLAKLNPIIRGWCNHFRTVTSAETFGKQRLFTHQCLLKWAQRKHPTRGKGYLYKKYFVKQANQLRFGMQSKNGPQGVITVKYHNSYLIKRHAKVQNTRSPYDGDVLYWTRRMSLYGGVAKRAAKLPIRQKGRCKGCGLSFQMEHVMKVDPIKPLSQGGKTVMTHHQLLHGVCHDQKEKA